MRLYEKLCQSGIDAMQSRQFFEVHVKIGDDWKLSASFETEAEARRYAQDMRKKVSYRIVRDRYDADHEKFKGRRILKEVILDEPDSLAGSLAARAKAQEELLAQRQARQAGIAPTDAAAAADTEGSLFERFVDTLKEESGRTKDA